MAENKIIDSLTFGDSNYTIAIPYGTCATAAATAAKAVTCANFIALETGASINVKFTYANSVANPTLNVNNTGAKSIVRYGTTKPTASDSTSWVAGAVVTFTYDGTYWVINSSPDRYTGNITGVTAGNGLTGGGSSGSVTLNVGAGSGITVDTDTVSHADTSTLEGSYGPTADVTQSAKSTASIVVPQITVDGFGHVTGVTNRTFTVTDTNTDPNANTWRKVQLNGIDKLGTGTSTNPLNIKAGKDMSITESSGTFTFNGETNFENFGTHSEIGSFKYSISSGTYTRSQAFKTIIGSTYFYGFLDVVRNSSGTITSYNVIMWGSATIYYLTYTVSSSTWSDTVRYLSTTDHTHSSYAASDHTHDYSNTYAAKSHTHSGYLTSHQTIKQDGITGATVNRFGTCSTAAATAAKTVSITSGTFTLEAGARVTVKFTNANTANTPTLNVASKGAKNIYHKGAQITTGTNKSLLAGTVDFVYDGTQWHLVGNYIDTNTTYSSATQSTAGLMSATDKTKVDNLAAAANKGVDTSISAGSTSTNLPTSKAVAAFVEGKGYKTTDNNTTYTIATGDNNGQIKVTPSSGSAYNVDIKGLGSSAFVTNWTAVECTTFTSDEGSCTPAAVKKAVGMFEPKAHTHSEYAASDHTHNGYVSTAELSELADDLNNHTHNYAGSSSAGGAATSANKVNSSLVVKLNSGTTEGTNLFTFNGSAAKTINITPSSIGAAASSHGTHVTADTVKSALGTGTGTTKFLREDGTWATPAGATYSLVGTNGTTGLVKNGSSVTSTSGLTACPIISGVPYYKDTNTQSNYGNITTSGTITSTAVTSATGVLVYDSNNKIQRATAANLRTIIGAGTSNLAIGTTSTTAAAGNHTHSIYDNTVVSVSSSSIFGNLYTASNDAWKTLNVITNVFSDSLDDYPTAMAGVLGGTEAYTDGSGHGEFITVAAKTPQLKTGSHGTNTGWSGFWIAEDFTARWLKFSPENTSYSVSDERYLVTSTSSSIKKMTALTQSAYNSATKDSSTLYIIS